MSLPSIKSLALTFRTIGQGLAAFVVESRLYNGARICQERYKSLRNDHGVEEESSKTVEIKNLEIPENIVLTLLGVEGVLDWKRLGKNLVVELPENFEKQYAYTIKVGGIRNQYDLYHPGQL